MRRGRSERGAAGLELAIVAPLMIALVLMIVGFGRMSLAKAEVNSAANEAARAASLERAPGAAAGVGEQAARRTLSDRGMSCAELSVNVDTSSYAAGGSITASVTCVTRLSDVAMIGMPGSKTYRSSATVPIEQFRAER